jgi:hypothetical protein
MSRRDVIYGQKALGKALEASGNRAKTLDAGVVDFPHLPRKKTRRMWATGESGDYGYRRNSGWKW